MRGSGPLRSACDRSGPSSEVLLPRLFLRAKRALDCDGILFSAKQTQCIGFGTGWNTTDLRNVSAKFRHALKSDGPFKKRNGIFLDSRANLIGPLWNFRRIADLPPMLLLPRKQVADPRPTVPKSLFRRLDDKDFTVRDCERGQVGP